MNNLIRGKRNISILIRPPKIIFLLTKFDQIEKFIQISSQSICGINFLPIPVGSDFKINKEWKNVIKKYNPDSILHFEDLPESLFLEVYKLIFDFIDVNPVNNVTIHKKIDAKDLSREYFGQSVGNFFVNDKFLDFDSSGYLLDLIYVPKEDENWDIFYKSRFGILDTDFLYGVQTFMSNQKWAGDPKRNINQYKFDPEKSFFNNLVEVDSISKNGSTFISLLDYSTRNIQRFNYPNIFFTPVKSTIRNFIIVSEMPNIEEFCWYWSFRSQKEFGFLPTWIPKEDFISAVNMNYFNNRRIFILSKTVKRSFFDKFNLDIQFQNDNFDEYYSDIFQYGILENQLVDFYDNQAYINLPSTELNNKVSFDSADNILDIHIPSIKLPNLSTKYWLNDDNFPIEEVKKISNFGISEFFPPYINSRIKKLWIPNSWTIINNIAKLAGYDVSISEKGRLAEKFLDLIGDYNNFWLVSGEKIIDLFLDLSGIGDVNFRKNKIREKNLDQVIENEIIELFPRKSLTDKKIDYYKIKDFYNGFCDELVDEIINWFVNKNIIIQGAVTKCPFCAEDIWLKVDDFKSKIICHGCSSTIQVPFGIKNLNFHYQLNSILGRLLDQGLWVHLLTNSYMINQALDKNQDIQFCQTNLELKKKNKGNLELDIALFINGEFIIGECKVDSKRFTEKEILKTFENAIRVNAQKIIFSCLNQTNDDLYARIHLLNKTSIKWDLLFKEDLFNQFPHFYSMDKSGNYYETRRNEYIKHLKFHLLKS